MSDYCKKHRVGFDDNTECPSCEAERKAKLQFPFKVSNPCPSCKGKGDKFTCFKPESCELNQVPDKVAGIIEERGGLAGTGRYGPFIDNAVIAQELKDIMRQSPNWEHKLNAAQREALDLIMMKISRILSGDPNYIDNWDDIQGYCRLAQHNWQKDAS